MSIGYIIIGIFIGAVVACVIIYAAVCVAIGRGLNW